MMLEWQLSSPWYIALIVLDEVIELDLVYVGSQLIRDELW